MSSKQSRFADPILLICGAIGMLVSSAMACSTLHGRGALGCEILALVCWAGVSLLLLRYPLFGLRHTCAIAGLYLCVQFRLSFFDYISPDYVSFLGPWTDTMRNMSVPQALRTPIGDYNMPYLYLLLLISRLPLYDLYCIKLISVLADLFLALAAAKLVRLTVRRDGLVLAAFFGALLAPTVFLNSAYWGQCDAIYVSICLMALYLGMTRRSAGCLFLFGVALSFKLQTVFFLPVLLPLWLRRDLKLRHLPLIPAAYMVMMIPALWGGKSLHHVLTCYFQQAGQYNFMTMNGNNLWQLLPSTLTPEQKFRFFSPMAMMMAFAVLLAVCALVCLHRGRISHRSVMLFCLLSLSAVPYFLPKMHERYTFGADVLSVAVAACCPRLFFLPLLFGFASYLCYTGGLPGGPLIPLRWAAIVQGAAVLVTAAALVRSLACDERTEEVKG